MNQSIGGIAGGFIPTVITTTSSTPPELPEVSQELLAMNDKIERLDSRIADLIENLNPVLDFSPRPEDSNSSKQPERHGKLAPEDSNSSKQPERHSKLAIDIAEKNIRIERTIESILSIKSRLTI